jgi:hypothetical protein
MPPKLAPAGLTRARAPGTCRTQSLRQPCPRGSRESRSGGRPWRTIAKKRPAEPGNQKMPREEPGAKTICIPKHSLGDPQRQEHVCFAAEARGEHQIRATKKSPGDITGAEPMSLKTICKPTRTARISRHLPLHRRMAKNA